MSKVFVIKKKSLVFASMDFNAAKRLFLCKISPFDFRGYRCLTIQREILKKPSTAYFSANSPKIRIKKDNFDLEDNSYPLFKLRKVAIVGKTTRYDFERQRFPNLNDKEFEKVLKSRALSFDKLSKGHQVHQKSLNTIVSVLKRRKISYEIISRSDLDDCSDKFEWADVIVAAGGDGTFLSTASKITNRDKPIIGINTDPKRSEGHLCLPASSIVQFDKVLDQIQTNQFMWLFRTRLRITLRGPSESFVPLQNGETLQDNQDLRPFNYISALESSDDSYLETRPHKYSQRPSLPSIGCKDFVGPYNLPILALNEIFFGELLASVPTYYEMEIKGSKIEKQKSSGICICTGTGSTAWSYNICSLHKETIKKLIKFLPQSTIDTSQEKMIENVTKSFCDSHILPPDHQQMFFSIRDPMQNNIYTCCKPQGLADEIRLQSHCWDAALSIDGNISFTFNDGASAVISVHHQDQLRTILLNKL